MTTSLDVISIPPRDRQPPQRLLVSLHGWGANGADLASLSSIFNLSDCQFLYPTAPFDHPDVPGGKAWYALETREYAGLDESRELLRDWLLALPDNTGVPLSRTVLGGFSQGGAMALDVGLELPLAGICCLSGYLQFQPQPSQEDWPPILLIHGRRDMVVPIAAARQAQAALSAIGAEVNYREFDMGHEIPLEIIPIIQSFIEERTAS